MVLAERTTRPMSLSAEKCIFEDGSVSGGFQGRWRISLGALSSRMEQYRR